MYSKSEAAALKREFWIAFGSYMKPIVNADGQTVNWVNYKTGVKNLFFRSDVTNKKARLAIEISSANFESRELLFNKFISLKNIFDEYVFGEWIWVKEAYDEHGKGISTIYIEKEGVNIFNKNDWAVIISFLKQHLISLDLFWCMVKADFE